MFVQLSAEAADQAGHVAKMGVTGRGVQNFCRKNVSRNTWNTAKDG